MCLGSYRDQQDEHIDYVLGGARTILEIGKDALDVAPIPGLKVAANAASALIDMALVRFSRYILWIYIDRTL